VLALDEEPMDDPYGSMGDQRTCVFFFVVVVVVGVVVIVILSNILYDYISHIPYTTTTTATTTNRYRNVRSESS